MAPQSVCAPSRRCTWADWIAAFDLEAADAAEGQGGHHQGLRLLDQGSVHRAVSWASSATNRPPSSRRAPRRAWA